MGKKNKKEKTETKAEREISSELETISKQIKENVEQETLNRYITQRQKNSTNPRVPFPHNMYQNKPTLVTATQVRHDPNLYNHLNSNPANTTGCLACRRRLWEPL